MNDEPRVSIEREVLGWNEVWKKRDENDPGSVGITGYRLGRPQIGHPHGSSVIGSLRNGMDL